MVRRERNIEIQNTAAQSLLGVKHSKVLAYRPISFTRWRHKSHDLKKACEEKHTIGPAVLELLGGEGGFPPTTYRRSRHYNTSLSLSIYI